jgi:uracil-DNA glycosylase family 4
MGVGFGAHSGDCTNGVLLVGECLTSAEAIEGYPMSAYGENGSILERAIKQIGMTRNQFGMYTLVACQPPGSILMGEAYEQPAIDHCTQHHLAKVIRHFKPRVIVPLGATATRVLTGLSGDKLGLDLIRGFPLAPSATSAPYIDSDTVIIPSYAPSYIRMGQQALLLVLQRDLVFAVKTASAKAAEAQAPEGALTVATSKVVTARNYNPRYAMHVTEHAVSSLLNWIKQNPNHPISYDFEAVGSITGDLSNREDLDSKEMDITQVNLSLGPEHAVVYDYNSHTKGLTWDILGKTPNPKYGHNVYYFDNPVAEWNGFEVRGSRLDDTLQSFHFLYSDIPGSKGGKETKGHSSQDDDGAYAPLQFCASFYGFPLPWKHLSKEDPHLYGAYDADSAAWVRNGTFKDLNNFGIFHAYDTFVVELRKELRMMERRGHPASRTELQQLSTMLKARIVESRNLIQAMVPDDLKPVAPIKKEHKAMMALAEELQVQIPRPKDIVQPREWNLLTAQQHEFVNKAAALVVKDTKDKIVALGFRVNRFEFYNEKCTCLAKQISDIPATGCKLCDGTGYTRGSVKTVKCESCLRGKVNCNQCNGTGLSASVKKGPTKKRGKKNEIVVEEVQPGLFDVVADSVDVPGPVCNHQFLRFAVAVGVDKPKAKRVANRSEASPVAGLIEGRERGIINGMDNIRDTGAGDVALLSSRNLGSGDQITPQVSAAADAERSAVAVRTQPKGAILTSDEERGITNDLDNDLDRLADVDDSLVHCGLVTAASQRSGRESQGNESESKGQDDGAVNNSVSAPSQSAGADRIYQEHPRSILVPAGTFKPKYEVICKCCGAYGTKPKVCACVKTPVVDCNRCGGQGLYKVYDQKVCKCRLRMRPSFNCEECHGTGLFTGHRFMWSKIKPFNVSSSQQMMRYAQLKGYNIPMNSKRKIAMDKETIIKMAKRTKDPVFGATIGLRELTKIESSYASAWLKRLKPHSIEEGTRGGIVNVSYSPVLDSVHVGGNLHAGNSGNDVDHQQIAESPIAAGALVVRGQEADRSTAEIIVRPSTTGSDLVRELSTQQSGNALDNFALAESRLQQLGERWDSQDLEEIELEYMHKYHEACARANLATVHTEFQFKPASGQLSSQNPNVQVSPNQSKYGQLATDFRRAIVAPPGYTFIEFDYRSFHVLTLAYEAQDPDYIRLARLDPHSFVAANMLGLPGCQSALALPDNELRAYLAMVKKNHETTRNKQAKPAILGYGFGMGAGKLYDLNQEAFRDFDEARHTLDMLNACFPKTAQYRLSSPEQAHRQKYLMSAFGCIRWFMNVKTWDSATNSYKHGKDWEKSIAFRPANNAFCVIKLAKLQLRYRGLAARYGLINNIHDAMLFCCPNKYVEEALHTVKPIMEAKVPQITAPDGSPFWCETEAKLGPTWADTKEYHYNV